LSAHNCKNKDGKSYLCVQNRRATCYVRLWSTSFSSSSVLMKKILENRGCCEAEFRKRGVLRW
jgi:hypothetical protein